MSIFKGAGVAIVTPMKNNEEVNYDRLEQMIEYQINQGTDCIIIAGTTGESSTLTTEEHAEVIKAAVKFAKHRIPVVAGTGSNCTREAIHLFGESIGKLHVVIVDKTKRYSVCAWVKIFIYSLARRESKAHRCNTECRTDDS